MIVGKTSLRPLADNEAIRKGLQTSYADRNNMPAKDDFYVAQLSMFDKELRRYTQAVQTMDAKLQWFAEDAKIAYHFGSIDIFLSYAIVLLETASLNLANDPRYRTVARQYDHPFHVFKGAELVVYGRFSGLTHDDHAPYVGTAICEQPWR